MTIRGEVGNLTVRVASDILDGGIAGRTLVEALDGHNGEDLVDGPRVAQTLEEREVTEILVCEKLVDLHQLLRDMLQTLGEGVDLVAYAPVHRLHLSTRLQIDDTV